MSSSSSSKKNSKSTKNKQYLIAVGGSFNPLHVSHIEMLVSAKKHLEKKGGTVVGGFLAVAKDGYLKNKLPEGAALSGKHRLEMCKLAIVEAKLHSWLCVCVKEEKTYGSASEVLTAAKRQIEEYKDCETFVIVGGDRAKRRKGHLCVARAGTVHSPDDLPPVKEVSSTIIRQKYCKSDQTLQQAVDEGLIHKCVAKYLIDNNLRQQLYDSSKK